MKRILSLILLLVLLTGCTITGKVVDEMDKQPTKADKEVVALDKAIADKDIMQCYYIQTQQIREKCFLSLAQELNDSSICKNLLGSLKESCITSLN